MPRPIVYDVVTSRPLLNRRSSFICSELYVSLVGIQVVTSADLANGTNSGRYRLTLVAGAPIVVAAFSLNCVWTFVLRLPTYATSSVNLPASSRWIETL